MVVYVERMKPEKSDSLPSQARADPGGTDSSLKPKKVALFTKIFLNSENSIRDIRQFCRPLFYRSSVVGSILHLSHSREPVMRVDY